MKLLYDAWFDNEVFRISPETEFTLDPSTSTFTNLALWHRASTKFDFGDVMEHPTLSPKKIQNLMSSPPVQKKKLNRLVVDQPTESDNTTITLHPDKMEELDLFRGDVVIVKVRLKFLFFFFYLFVFPLSATISHFIGPSWSRHCSHRSS